MSKHADVSEEIGFRRPDARERYAQIVQAVVHAISVTDINDSLPEGVEWLFDSVGPDRSRPGRITIEGYRDSEMDDGVEIVIQVKHIDFGPHRLTFEEEKSDA